ncbi:MAG: thiol oxidoreductase [Candidatus Latescibacteria bacterium]|nr:thiol oxidoreductase [Candidatus Latescibacterota bacterium]
MKHTRFPHPRFIRTVTAVLAGLFLFTGCNALVTNPPKEGETFDAPLPGLAPHLNVMFSQGDGNFDHVFTIKEGLGPLFNHTACAGCHPGDGRGPSSVTFFRFTVPGGDPLLTGEPQLQQFSIPGVPPETLPSGALTSPRAGPPVFGMGLIEAIPESEILSREDPGDANGDGISGRANRVPAADFVPVTEVGGRPGLNIGRFGLKANNTSLLAQVVGAYHQDIGMTSEYRPVENPNPLGHGVSVGDEVADPEISAATVLQTVMYLRLLAPPARGRITPAVTQGEQVFQSIGCATCHVPTMRTGPHDIPQLSNQDVHLYSDLLLHDLGPELADGRPDHDATGTEWRTRPLWGLRLVGRFLGGLPVYLHDARTSDLAEAIRLHGGEAQGARDRFLSLSEADRRALIAFLNSL